MKGKEDLFDLIQAMSPSEKRYFTLDAQKSSRKGSRYLELFQMINSMEEYDEDLLRRKFSRNLPFDKAYLYDAILRSMRDYHSARLRSARIKERLLDARYLFERGLYDQCEVRLEEARQFAEELSDKLALLEVNREFRRLILARKGRDFEEKLAAASREGAELLTANLEEFEYLEIYEVLLSRVIRKFELRGQQEKADFQKTLPARRLSEPQSPHTPLGTLKYYQSLALYHQLLGDFERVMDDFSRAVEWWDAHPKYKEEEFYRYIIDFSNLLHAFTSNGQVHALPPLIQQLENSRPESETARSILFQKVTIYRLISYINLGITEDLDKLVAEISRGLDTFQVQTSTRSALISNTAILLFIRGWFADCVVWCGRIIGDRKSKYRQDIRLLAHLLNLVATFEVADWQLLEATYRSTYRFLRKQGSVEELPFEWTVMDFLRRLVSEPREEWPSIWSGFQVYLGEAMANPALKISHGLGQLLALWVESRRLRRPITQVLEGQRRAEAR